MSNTKKNLLNENMIRRFMKLAEIDKLSDGFVVGLVEGAPVEEEEEVNEEMEGFDVAPEDGPADGPSGMGDLEDTEDMDMAPEEAPETAALADAVSNLMNVISDLTGVEIDVDGGEEDDLAAPEEDDLAVVDVDVDDEPDVMAEGEGDSPFSIAAGTGARGAAKRARGDAMARKAGTKEPVVDQSASYPSAGQRITTDESLQRAAAYRHALKQEVYNRVSARLQQESRNDAVADQLSERILQRIKNQPKK